MVMQVPDFVKYYSVQLFSSLALAATRLFLPNLAKLLGAVEAMLRDLYSFLKKYYLIHHPHHMEKGDARVTWY